MTRFLPLLLALVPALAHAAPLCLPEATAAALGHLGTRLDPRHIARQLPVHADGVDLFDLRLWLEDQGHAARVFAPDPKLVQPLVDRGLPVVLVRNEPQGRHAVALVPGQRKLVTVLDSRASAPQVVPWPVALRNAHAAMALGRGRALEVPAVIARTDAEFLATGWLRRAREHQAPSEAQLVLVVRALTADPCHEPAHVMARDLARKLPPTPWVRETLGKLPKCER